MIKTIFTLLIVVLAGIFPKFKSGFSIFFIIAMTLLSSIFFFGAYADHTNGEPAWIVRNMIIFGMIILAIGWILGLAINWQAKKYLAMTEEEKKEILKTINDATDDERGWAQLVAVSISCLISNTVGRCVGARFTT